MEAKDITGKTFGRLTVMYKTGIRNGMMHWVCQCECGKEKEVCGNHLRTGHTQSCGCLSKEHGAKLHTFVAPNPAPRNSEKLYRVWKGMRSRCQGNNTHHKKYYASNGIIVCPEWNDYLIFKSRALSNGYKDGLTIDRMNNCDHYRPDNCRWITMFAQASNKTNNRWITIHGVTKTLSQWSRVINRNPSAVHAGLSRNGTSYIEARLTPGVYGWKEVTT